MATKQQLKYIVLSDLHLGEKDSLFAADSGGKSKLLDIFSECLSTLLGKFNEDGTLPVFIFNGDILGLAFSTYKESLRAFSDFVEAITVTNKLCDRVAYIPGNHDHHIWQLAIEDDYKKRLADRVDAIPELITASSVLYQNGLNSDFMTSFMKALPGKPSELKILYPNFLLPPCNVGDPFVFFHHGHFAEDTYHFVSKAMKDLYPELPEPDSLSELELENGYWIDFAFSQLGRSGDAGKYFGKLMQTLSNKEMLDKHVDEFAKNLAKNLDFPYLPFDWMEQYLAKRLLYNISEKVRGERYKGNASCTDETMQNLMHYFNKFCYPILLEHGWKNDPVHFVWSHTHKPFYKMTDTEKFGKVEITNTGGWVMPAKPSPKHGASIVLINQANEVQSLNVFMDVEDGEKGVFKVLKEEGKELSEFGKSINDHLYKEGTLTGVWANFKKLLEEKIDQQRLNNEG